MPLKSIFLFIFFLTSCASQPPCKGLTNNCNNGDGGACFELGTAVFGTIGKINPDPETTKDKAAKWFKRGCDLGHDKSCTELANYKGYLKNGRSKKL
jgi:TPR repeat protein